MKNSKVKGLIGLLVLLFAVGLFGFFGYDTMDDIKLGLDLGLQFPGAFGIYAYRTDPPESAHRFTFQNRGRNCGLSRFRGLIAPDKKNRHRQQRCAIKFHFHT